MKPLKERVREDCARPGKYNILFRFTVFSIDQRIKFSIPLIVLRNHIEPIGDNINQELHERLIYVTRK